MDAPSFSGWGIRTLAEGEARYNPMSYHNGSVGPHDNALIAMGFGRYGLKEPLLRLMTGMFDAALFLDLKRLPELFCGFPRRPGMGTTAYPVACAPQAWASAAVFGMLGAALGIAFDAEGRKIRFIRPALPAWVDELKITGLTLGANSMDLLLRRSGAGVAIEILGRVGPIELELTS
jgi:glycogen debranching enzyme